MTGSITTRALALLLAAAAASGSACAMNSVSQEGLRCTVDGEDKLPPELGGEAGICAAITRAALPQLQRAGIAPNAVSVKLTVKSSYIISAVGSVNGQATAEQNVSSSDRPLHSGAIEMLARAVAGELAKAQN